MLHRIHAYCRRAVDELRFQGAGIVLWRLTVKLLSPLVRIDHQILLEFDLTRPVPDARARIDCDVRPATEAEISILAQQRLPPMPPGGEHALSDVQEHERFAEERQVGIFRRNSLTSLRAGEMCFVATVGSEFAHFNWIRFDWCGPAPDRPIHLRTGEVYTTGAFTPPKWRGKGLHDVVNAAMLRHAQDIGCARAYTIADLVSAGSRRGLMRVGWTRRGHHLFVAPRGVTRRWIVVMGGDVEPVLAHFSEGRRITRRIVALP